MGRIRQALGLGAAITSMVFTTAGCGKKKEETKPNSEQCTKKREESLSEYREWHKKEMDSQEKLHQEELDKLGKRYQTFIEILLRQRIGRHLWQIEKLHKGTRSRVVKRSLCNSLRLDKELLDMLYNSKNNKSPYYNYVQEGIRSIVHPRVICEGITINIDDTFNFSKIEYCVKNLKRAVNVALDDYCK